MQATVTQTRLDAETYRAGLDLSLFHIERGAYAFAAYSKVMVTEMGAEVIPYLKGWYLAVKFDPACHVISARMDAASSVERARIESPSTGGSTTEEESRFNWALIAMHAVFWPAYLFVGGVPGAYGWSSCTEVVLSPLRTSAGSFFLFVGWSIAPVAVVCRSFTAVDGKYSFEDSVSAFVWGMWISAGVTAWFVLNHALGCLD